MPRLAAPLDANRALINHDFIDDESVLDGIAVALEKDDFVQPVKLQFVDGASLELLQRNLYLNPFSWRKTSNELF